MRRRGDCPVSPHLRRAISFDVPDLKGVFPFLERLVVAPDHLGRFGEGRPQGPFPRIAVYSNLDFGDASVSGVGDTADWYQPLVIFLDNIMNGYSIDN